MTDLKLEVGEGILLQTTDAGLYNGNDEISIDELYLTNRYLICVYEKSTGFFKSETVVDKIPLSSIAVINGIVQIQQVDDDDYGKSLQIVYTSGKRELLEFNVSPKKQYSIWKDAISNAVMHLANGAPEHQQVVAPPVVPVHGPVYSQPVESVRVQPVEQTLSETAQTVTEKASAAPENAQNAPAPVPDKMSLPYLSSKRRRKVDLCSVRIAALS